MPRKKPIKIGRFTIADKDAARDLQKRIKEEITYLKAHKISAGMKKRFRKTFGTTKWKKYRGLVRNVEAQKKLEEKAMRRLRSDSRKLKKFIGAKRKKKVM